MVCFNKYANLFEEGDCVEEDDGNAQEFITLGAPTAEEILRVMEQPVANPVDHPSVVTDISAETFKLAVECYDDLVSVMVYPELELVLKYLNGQLIYMNPSPVLSWEDGRLAINGVKTKIRACLAFDAVKHLGKIGTHERASEAVAQLLVEKIKVLF